MGRKLLVTGGAGFIGVNFVRHWLESHPADRVVVLDKLTYAGNPASLAGLDANPNYRFVHADILDQALVEGLLGEEGIDTLVHFAAESHVDRSIHGPGEFLKTNIMGTHALLAAARAVWLAGSGRPHRFHHVSTDEVYGSLSMDAPAFTETHAYQPNSPYSASKAASDHLVRAYHHTYGLAVTTTNCSNNYGPYQFPEKLIPLIFINVLEGRPLPVYGAGLNVRDWLYVTDHCRGIELAIERGEPGRVYNIGGDCEKTNIEVVKTICRSANEMFERDPGLAERFPGSPAARGQAEELITYVTDRAGHDLRYAIDATRIEAELGYKPAENFERGLAATLAWYLENEAWWRAVMDGSYQKWIKANYGA